MSKVDTESGLSSDAILLRGKLALEALHFREEAARLHAAKMDLQAALGDAENGNSERLQNWLAANQSLLDVPKEVENRSLFEGGQKLSRLSQLPANKEWDAEDSSATRNKHPQKTDLNSPHLKAIAPLTNSVEDIVHNTESKLEADSDVSDTTYAREDDDSSSALDTFIPTKTPSPWDSMMQAALARQKADSASVVLSEVINDEIESESLNTDADEPIVVPEYLRNVVNSEKESDTGLKKLLWLSPALMWSTGAHLIAIVGMSVYVISVAARTEPMAIVASPVETETVSMEAPTEMAPSDSPDIEPTSVTTPNLPTVATPIASVSTSSMVLPTVMAGDAPGEKPSSLGSAIGDAIGSTMSAIPATAGAQFFGVNAAGNTFCYIVDRSGSMRNGAFESAKEEIVRSLSTMKPKQRFYIFFFGEEIEGMKLDGRSEEAFPVYATPENIQKTIVWMDRVKIQSGKHPADVISRAIEMEPDGIFLLFDGETSVDLAPRIRKSNQVYDIVLGDQTRVPIHSVCFYTEKPEAQKLMKTIAEQNLGTYRYVPRPPGSNVGKRKFP